MDHAETDVPVNERQQWFPNQLEEGGSVQRRRSGASLERDERTAERDIADLKKQGNYSGT